MKKVTIEYQVENKDDEQAIKRAVSVDSVYCALWDIGQEVFRPARKHGYSDPLIAALFDEEKHGDLVGALEKKFYEILSGHEISVECL